MAFFYLPHTIPTLISYFFEEFLCVFVLAVLCRIAVNLDGEFIQITKVEYPEPMAVEGLKI